MTCEPKPPASIHGSEVDIPPVDPQFPHFTESASSDHDKQGVLCPGNHMSLPTKDEQSCWASNNLRPEVGDTMSYVFITSLFLHTLHV